MQSGVISRRQVLESGEGPHDIRRRVRRREWAPVHPGVYVNHTGRPSWVQRAWAAVLYAWPAALGGESALRAAEGPGRRHRDDSVIEILVGRHRHLVPPTGVRVRRTQYLDERVQWNVSPPRLRYEEAILDCALAATGFASIAVLADGVQGRRTTARRLSAALERRSQVRERRWLTDVLEDIAEGTSSVLEHGYLTRVERVHGLPCAARQLVFATVESRGYRDVEYAGRVIVELDGRLFHDSARGRDRDMDRDLDAAVDGRSTVRLSWGQVFDRPCRTASRLAILLQRNGWQGAPTPCGPSCPCG